MNNDFFNWTDEVTKDADEYVIFAPGKFPAKVTKIEKKRWEGSGKMNGCPYALITCEVRDGDTVGYVTDNLFLARSLEWKIGQFLHAFDLKKKGEPVRVDKIEKALNKPFTVAIECQAGKEDGYKVLSYEEVAEAMKTGKPVFNKVKAYEPAAKAAPVSDDSEFGFDA